jgi:putative transposase
VAAPRVNGKRTGPVTGERMRFCSAIVPPWVRKTPKVTGVLPLLYPHGLSSGDFVPALREVFAQARECRCWFHKTANVLAALPKPAHPGAKKALAEIWGAEDKAHARAAVKAFEAAYRAKFPQAVAKITGGLAQLLAFCGYPAEHWVHLQTTNPIESAFATVRHRTKVTKGPGSRAAGLAMAFKLIEAAQDRWRCVNAPHLVALARAGAVFRDGVLIERPEQAAA